MWRNQQIDVLRQKVEISKKEQIRYFRDKVWPDLDSYRPNQILLSIYQDGTHIGYGGLVHISWEDSRAEVSFLLDTRIDETGDIFTGLFKNFLAGIEKIATENLKLHKLVLETYSFRVNHIAVIEDSGFTREGILVDQVSVNGKWFNSILHGKILRENTLSRLSDCSWRQ
jgi:RimJ/RimL family protein N-acetyltransferase